MSRQKIEAMFAYTKLDEKQLAQVKRIRAAATALAIELLPADSHEKQVALQKLEEAVMWANKGVSRS